MSGTYRVAAAVFACAELAAATAAGAVTAAHQGRQYPATRLPTADELTGFHPKSAAHRAWCVRSAQS